MFVLAMWGVTLIFVSCVATQVASQDIKLECDTYDGGPPVKNITPSIPVDLKVALLTEAMGYKLNISWAVNNDPSIQYLTATRIVITGEDTYHCKYNPPLTDASFMGSKQRWFHYLVDASYGSTPIQAANLPLPMQGSGKAYKYTKIEIPRFHHSKEKTQVPSVESTALCKTSQVSSNKLIKDNLNFSSMALIIFGGLACFMILSSFYVLYKNFGTSLGFKKLPTSPMVPVPVLLVYPAEHSAFQQAVVALAEFLQWHGSCSMAVDMWQQGKIAELGPMRWLAEQVKTADRVLIVCPQPSLQPSDSPPNHSLPELSIPAAAHDLYPLILNMVASQARSTSDLAKFWVVQLGKRHNTKSHNLPLELRACETFCLMKDLVKMCRSLHAQRRDRKTISHLIFRQEIEKSAVTLREAVEKLGRHQPSIFRAVEPLNSVVTSI